MSKLSMMVFLFFTIAGYPTKSEGSIFEKPAGVADEDFLSFLLKETALSNDVSDIALNMFVNTIKDLMIKNATLVNTKIGGIEAKKYALYNCYAAISKVLHEKPENFNKPPKKKEVSSPISSLFATAKTQELATFILKSNKGEGIKNKTIKPEGNPYQLSIKVTPYGLTAIDPELHCQVIQNIKKEGASISTLMLECNSFCGKRISIELKDIQLKDEAQGLGIGTLVMQNFIALTKQLLKMVPSATEAHIWLLARPSDEKLLPSLMDFYKAFGFVPAKMTNNMSMFINKNGTILKKYEFKEGWEKDRLLDRQRCKDTLKKSSKK